MSADFNLWTLHSYRRPNLYWNMLTTICHCFSSAAVWFLWLLIWSVDQLATAHLNKDMWWTVLPQSWGDRIIARSVSNVPCAMKRGITWQCKIIPMIAVWPCVGRVQLQIHLFFKVHTRGRWVVSFTAWMFYPHERNFHLPLDWNLCRPHIWSAHFWRRDNYLAFGRNWRPYHPFYSVVTISAKLSHRKNLLVLSTLPEPHFLWSEKQSHQDLITVIHCLSPHSSISLHIQRDC